MVSLDGSRLAEEALPVAATLGAALGVPLHVVIVVTRSTIMSPSEAPNKEAEDHLAQQVRLLAARDVAAASEVHFGDVVPSLLDAVRPDDLVVMTTRGRGGLQRWLLGNVAEQLVRW